MKNHDPLEEFINDHKLTLGAELTIVTTHDLAPLRSAGHTVQELLDHLGMRKRTLFHGSRTHIADECLIPKGPEGQQKVYASSLAAIAIMRAIISNRGLTGAGLCYPYFINDRSPLEVRIHGINPRTIGERGYVYLLDQQAGFTNTPKGSWQYIVENRRVPIQALVEVVRADFTYPIIDVTNQRRLQ